MIVVAVAALPLVMSGSAIDVTAETTVNYENDVTLLVASSKSSWVKRSICLIYELLCKGDKVNCKSYTVFGTILILLELFFLLVLNCISKDAMYVAVADECHELIEKCKKMSWCRAQYDTFLGAILVLIPSLREAAKLGLLSGLLVKLKEVVVSELPKSEPPGLLGNVGKIITDLL